MKQVSLETGICHFQAKAGESLKAFLAGLDLSELNLSLSESLAEDWLFHGSVYLDGHRQRCDVTLSAGQILRLHTRRKRYPGAVGIDWNRRILAKNEDFLVFNKPSGLPTHPTLDNYVENALYLLQEELQEPLFTTHRLDIPTSGLLIFARHKQAQAAINREFAKRRVEKIYRALAPSSVPLGLHTHYIDPNTRVPRTIRTEAQSGWWECRLEVLSATATERGFEHEVRLLTGKTHQIRAQFATLGSPLLGDITYGGKEGDFGLQCTLLSLQLRQTRHSFHLDEGISK